MATITVPPQVRSGTITTPSASWPTGTKAADLSLTMPVQADRDNSSNTIEIRIEFSKDGGVTFKPYVMAGWRGGSGKTSGGVLNPPPSIFVLGPGSDADVRATFILSAAMTVGAVLVTT